MYQQISVIINFYLSALSWDWNIKRSIKYAQNLPSGLQKLSWRNRSPRSFSDPFYDIVSQSLRELKSLQIDCSFITATDYANLAAGLRNLEEVIFDYSSSVHPDAATLDDICTFFETCTQLKRIELMHLRVTPQQMQRIVGPHIKSLILSRMLGNYFEDPYDVNMWYREFVVNNSFSNHFL